jgi:hypothetical protein
MKQIEFIEMENFAAGFCRRCSGLMRLVGSESHPVKAKTDLLTYCCTACEEYLVMPIKHPANDARPQVSPRLNKHASY